MNGSSLLVVGLGAIFLALAVKSRHFDDTLTLRPERPDSHRPD